jgi:hypothetical protein
MIPGVKIQPKRTLDLVQPIQSIFEDEDDDENSPAEEDTPEEEVFFNTPILKRQEDDEGSDFEAFLNEFQDAEEEEVISVSFVLKNTGSG